MKAKMATLVISTLLGTTACPVALAQDSLPATRFTVGAKVWHASWLSYLPSFYSGVNASGQPVIGDTVDAVEGRKKTNLMPTLAVSRFPYSVSASHGRFSSDFSALTSPIVLPTGQTLIGPRTDHLKRRETDINLGYAVTPEVALSVGYKDATETRDVSFGATPQRTPLLRTRVRGLLLGMSASFPVKDKLRFYAQAAYGPARLKADFYDRGASLKTDGRYLIGELGLSYGLYSKPDGSAAAASIGYRTQTVKTDSFDNVFQDGRKLRDVRDGLVLSLNVAL
jgi:hypothetical protein